MFSYSLYINCRKYYIRRLLVNGWILMGFSCAHQLAHIPGNIRKFRIHYTWHAVYYTFNSNCFIILFYYLHCYAVARKCDSPQFGIHHAYFRMRMEMYIILHFWRSNWNWNAVLSEWKRNDIGNSVYNIIYESNTCVFHNISWIELSKVLWKFNKSGGLICGVFKSTSTWINKSMGLYKLSQMSACI